MIFLERRLTGKDSMADIANKRMPVFVIAVILIGTGLRAAHMLGNYMNDILAVLIR